MSIKNDFELVYDKTDSFDEIIDTHDSSETISILVRETAEEEHEWDL